MEEEVKTGILQKAFVIFVIFLFLLALYFFVTYTFFAPKDAPPEGENAFLYAVKQVNPISLIFGTVQDKSIRPSDRGAKGYGETCPNGVIDCSICFECVDNDNNSNTDPICLPVNKRGTEQNCIGPEGCNPTNPDSCFCSGEISQLNIKVAKCIECLDDSDCKNPSMPICNQVSSICEQPQASDNPDWNLNEKPANQINIVLIVVGSVITLFLIVLSIFLISLFFKLKNVASGKKDSFSPELKSFIQEHSDRMNSILYEGYECLNKKDVNGARDVYEIIKKTYNPVYDPDRNIFDKIGEYYKRILKMETN